MPIFLVERYVPAGTDLGVAVRHTAQLARATAGGDSPVRYVWSAGVPDDETWFGWFEAADAAAVADLLRRASFPFDRISPAEVVPVEAEPGGA